MRRSDGGGRERGNVAASRGGNKNGKQGNDCEEGGEDAGGAAGAPGGWFIWEDAVNVVVAVSCVHVCVL